MAVKTLLTLKKFVIHGRCNGLGYKNKEGLSTDEKGNAILKIGTLRQSHDVNSTFISSLIDRHTF